MFSGQVYIYSDSDSVSSCFLRAFIKRGIAARLAKGREVNYGYSLIILDERQLYDISKTIIEYSDVLEKSFKSIFVVFLDRLGDESLSLIKKAVGQFVQSSLFYGWAFVDKNLDTGWISDKIFDLLFSVWPNNYSAVFLTEENKGLITDVGLVNQKFVGPTASPAPNTAPNERVGNRNVLSDTNAKRDVSLKASRNKLSGFALLYKKRRALILGFVFLVFFYLSLPLLLYILGFGLLRIQESRFFPDKTYLRVWVNGHTSNFVKKGLLICEKNIKFLDTSRACVVPARKIEDLVEVTSVLRELYGVNLGVEKTLLNLFQHKSIPTAEDVVRIEQDLKSVSTKLSILAADDNQIGLVKKGPLSKRNIYSTKKDIDLLAEISKKILALSEKNSVSRYAIVYEDEDVLRGSGGKIKKIGILEISSGEITSFDEYDISKLDQMLKGVPSPRVRIEDEEGNNEFLGFNGATLFSSGEESSVEIARQLDAALGITIDGVVILGETAENALKTDALKDNPFNLIRRLIKERYLSVFFLDENNKVALSVGGFFESEGTQRCGEDCFRWFVAPYEVSLTGGSKSVRKEISLGFSFEEGVVKGKMTYYITNRGDGVYKTYLGIATTTPAGFSPATIIEGGEKRQIDGDVFAGDGYVQKYVYLEILAKETKTISFYWEQEYMDNISKYRITVLKQPFGLGSNLFLSLKIKPKTGAFLASDDDFVLTKDGELVYNTYLLEDLDVVFYRNIGTD
jgi:hypothetical protein